MIVASFASGWAVIEASDPLDSRLRGGLCLDRGVRHPQRLGSRRRYVRGDVPKAPQEGVTKKTIPAYTSKRLRTHLWTLNHVAGDKVPYPSSSSAEIRVTPSSRNSSIFR